jgi:Zn-finger nucleic acid-binding protein
MVHPCPECGAELAGRIYDGVAFSECPQCAGVWFFEDDLKHLEKQDVEGLDRIDLLETPVKPAPAPTAALACPMCGGAMAQFHSLAADPVVLHRCAACEGLWMEHGQLTQMAAAVEAANKPPTPEEIALANQALAGPAAGSAPQPAPSQPGQAGRVESAAEIAFDQEHAATMAHYQRITSVARALGLCLPLGGHMW